jgi:probable HAF family extracellular repeat protein
MILVRKTTLFVAVIGVLMIATSVAVADYTITDLGVISGFTRSQAFGINDAGQVVGASDLQIRVDVPHAFIWQNGTMTDLGLGNFRLAYGINGSGQVVGEVPAFLWQNGTRTDLGPGAAYGINASGQIVGTSGSNAVLWQNGAMTTLGTGVAYGINASGQIVGFSGSNAVLWQNGAMTTLGTGAAYGINAFGQIVGSSNGGAVLWQNGTMTNLGSGFVANAINASGQVVGGTAPFGLYDPGGRAFLWQNGTLTDLDQLIPGNSGWTITNADAINDTGQIVGSGVHNGRQRAFLLTPSQTPVPEPATLMMLAGGSLVLIAWAWRQRRLPCGAGMALFTVGGRS